MCIRDRSSFFNTPDSGSSWYFDGLLTTQLTQAGKYYIEVTAVYPYNLDGLPEGVDYQLHVSVGQHAEDSFVFAPAPVSEQESTNNTGQSLDSGTTDEERGTNFFTFADPNIGNGVINSSTPYVRITGTGDGSPDVYLFDVASTKLSLTADTGSVLDPNNSEFYTRYVFEFTGTVEVGDRWTLGVGYRDYEVYVDGTTIGASLLSVANEFERLIEAAETAKQIDGYVANVSSTSGIKLTIENTASGFALELSLIHI